MNYDSTYHFIVYHGFLIIYTNNSISKSQKLTPYLIHILISTHHNTQNYMINNGQWWITIQHIILSFIMAF
jgi:hypothetical protein